MRSLWCLALVFAQVQGKHVSPITAHCANVVAELLTAEARCSIKKFAHPGTRRDLRKREVGTVQNSFKDLLSCIDKQVASWKRKLVRTECGAQADVDWF